MRTAVQLLSSGDTQASILAGAPALSAAGARGPIAVFEPGRLVAYALEHRGTQRLYVFRTAAALTSDLSEVPGVHPSVNLLMVIRHRTAARRLRKILRLLTTTRHDLDAIADTFWIRLTGVVTRRTPLALATLEQLLVPSRALATTAPTAPRSRGSHNGRVRGSQPSHLQLHAE